VNRPEGWERVSLEAVCVPGGLVRGPFGGSLKKSDFVAVGPQVYEQRNAIQGTVDARYFVTPTKFAEMSRFAVAEGDFIVSCSGTIGRIYQIPQDAPPGIINQALLKIRIDSGRIDPHFFRLYFQWEKFQDLILDSTQGGAMKNLVGMPVFRRSPVLVPPIAEQRAISAAVMDVDSEVRFLERLIAKKQAIKQGVLLQLLTGHIRLPGFDGVWPIVELSSVASGSRGSGLSKSAVVRNGRRKCLLYGELFTTYDRTILEVQSRTNEITSVASSSGQVLLPGSTTTVARDLAVASAILVDDVLIGGDVNVLTLDLRQVDPSWLAYFLTERRKDELAAAAQGITIVHLYVRSILGLNIPLPALAEQQAIAAVLQDADEELALLGKRLEKTCLTRQGMMQELLSGRTRLVPQGVAA
jgi:type I restriction enzyme S subunit